jgi:hypothetical protein
MCRITYSARSLNAATAIAQCLMETYHKDVNINYVTPDESKSNKQFIAFYSITIVEKKEDNASKSDVTTF